jgi:hypothetical protein
MPVTREMDETSQRAHRPFVEAIITAGLWSLFFAYCAYSRYHGGPFSPPIFGYSALYFPYFVVHLVAVHLQNEWAEAGWDVRQAWRDRYWAVAFVAVWLTISATLLPYHLHLADYLLKVYSGTLFSFSLIAAVVPSLKRALGPSRTLLLLFGVSLVFAFITRSRTEAFAHPLLFTLRTLVSLLAFFWLVFRRNLPLATFVFLFTKWLEVP